MATLRQVVGELPLEDASHLMRLYVHFGLESRTPVEEFREIFLDNAYAHPRYASEMAAFDRRIVNAIRIIELLAERTRQRRAAKKYAAAEAMAF